MTTADYRFWEIDLLRGIAVIMMIVFHVLYDLYFFNIFKIVLYSGFLLWYVYSIGLIFILLVGICLTLSYTKAKKKLTKKEVKLKFLFRGIKIFVLGLVITFATFLYLPKGFILFGVLHCIGISIILAYPFLQLHIQNLLFGVILISAGLYLKTFTVNFPWLIWLGFTPRQFYTVDYFPLLPWFGVILIGIFIGNKLYSGYKRRFNLIDLSRFRFVRSLCFIGRHSLIIYFLHQPIIIMLLYIFLL